MIRDTKRNTSLAKIRNPIRQPVSRRIETCLSFSLYKLKRRGVDTVAKPAPIRGIVRKHMAEVAIPVL